MKSQIDNRIYGFEDQNNGNGRSSESRQARLDGRVVTDEGEANTTKSEITPEMAYEGVSNYCHSAYDWSIA